MATETLDYAAVLGDLESKRTVLDNLINNLRTAMSVGALGQLGDGAGVVPTAVNGGGASVELPAGALMGKSIPAATKLYLSAVKKKQTTKEITNALRDGGVESTSKNFDNIVTTALHRLRMSGVLLRFKDGGWGLAELYPANIRASIGQPSKAKQATKRYRPPKKKIKRARTKKKPGEGLEASLAGHLHAHPDKAFTPSDLGGELGADPRVVAMTLARLIKKQTATKGTDGRYSAV